MKPILHIVGPTATGKTALALRLAKLFEGELISADSRQVYRGMAIGTGQDIPPRAKWKLSNLKLFGRQIGYYQTDKIKIWGYDLIEPNEAWSIAHFHTLTSQLLPYLHQQGRLPIIVGGSGFYHRSLDQPPLTIIIPPNPTLRRQLSGLTTRQLQSRLKRMSPARLAAFNQSDLANPRRLIRAIEIAIYQKEHPKTRFNKLKSIKTNSLWLGLDLPNSNLEWLIRRRVNRRLKSGFITEFNRLNQAGQFSLANQAATATGYSPWLSYRQGKIDRPTAIKQWLTAELQYAKRQKTWFKTNPDIRWFEAFDPASVSQIVETVKTWYSH
jgi:tRNA dimethylallyltransferase